MLLLLLPNRSVISRSSFAVSRLNIPAINPSAKNVLTLVTGSAADRLDCQAGDGDTNVAILGQPFFTRLHVVAVVNQNAPLGQVIDMIIVRVLVKGKQHVGFITGADHPHRSQGAPEK